MLDPKFETKEREEIMTTINDIELKTTFWNDFSIADQFGLDAVRDTYERTFKEWRENISYAKELVLVLNHKIFQHYEENPHLSEFYTKRSMNRQTSGVWSISLLKDEKKN